MSKELDTRRMVFFGSLVATFVAARKARLSLGGVALILLWADTIAAQKTKPGPGTSA